MSGDQQRKFEELLETGNDFYHKANEPDLDTGQRKMRLTKALSAYKSAQDCAPSSSNAASIAKNIGVVYCDIAKTVRGQYNAQNCLDPMIYYFKAAFEGFKKAVELGASTKNQEWNDYLLQKISDCLQDALTLTASMTAKDKKRFFESLCPLVPVDEFKADWCIEQCTLIFHEGLTSSQAGDYKRCLLKMHDCYTPLEEAKRFSSTEDHKREIRILGEDITIHTFSAEALQALDTADDLLNYILLDEESVNFDMVWEIIDMYKKSILLTRETDVEIECIALCRIGRVYDKVLKDKTRAKENFRTALNLSQTLFPRTFLNDDWYKECVSKLSQYQSEAQAEEDEKERESNQAILKELKTELEEIDKEDTSAENLLKHVYKTFPPKNTEHKLVLEGKYLKEVLKQAVCHYHPDKQCEEKHGKKWKVLAGEITKRLTKRYECFK